MRLFWKTRISLAALFFVLSASAALWPQTDIKPLTLNRVRVSPNMAERNLTHKVLPEYPHEAKENRIQGEVRLQVIIDRQGRVRDVKTVAGHPYLVPAATDAVKQWRYKPYLLNGEAVEVETIVTVNFNLAPRQSASS